MPMAIFHAQELDVPNTLGLLQSVRIKTKVNSDARQGF